MNDHATVPTARGQLTKPTRRDEHPLQSIIGSNILALIHRLVRYLFTPSTDSNSKVCPSFGPLVVPGLYRSYNDVYRALALIP